MALSVARQIIFDGSQDTTEITKVVETIDINEQEKYTAGKWSRKEVTISGATNMELDAGYFSDGFGNAINFATLYELWIWNTDDTDNLVLSGDVFSLWRSASAETETVSPDAWFGRANPSGWTIVNGASDTLTITPSANSPVAQIFIVGAE